MYLGLLFTVLGLLTALAITLKAIPAIITVARLKGLTDSPDEERKLHKKIVPTLGGIGIFGGFIIAFAIWGGYYLPDFFPALMAAITILFFIGIKDDILVISPYKKLAGQVLAAAIVVFGGEVVIPGLDGMFGIYQFTPWFGRLFSIFAIIIIINAYNLIDGVDGLAGMVSLVGSTALGTWFLAGGHYAEAIMCFALAGALVGFIYHNFEPARIFMGDTGSLIIGFLVAIAAFRLMQLNPHTTGYPLKNPALFAFATMIIPLFDTLRIIVVRISKGGSPLKADANHVHHNLLRFGLRHRQVTLVLTFANLFIVLVSLMIDHLNVYVHMLSLLVLAAILLPVFWFGNMVVNLFDEDMFKLSNEKLLSEKVFAGDMSKRSKHVDFNRIGSMGPGGVVLGASKTKVTITEE